MTIFFLFFKIIKQGDTVNVKIFDFEHELDLEEAINTFLLNKTLEIIDIKYQTSHFYAGNEQLFSFSVLILYKIKDK
jgi:hypothetical protein